MLLWGRRLISGKQMEMNFNFRFHLSFFNFRASHSEHWEECIGRQNDEAVQLQWHFSYFICLPKGKTTNFAESLSFSWISHRIKPEIPTDFIERMRRHFFSKHKAFYSAHLASAINSFIVSYIMYICTYTLVDLLIRVCDGNNRVQGSQDFAII